MSKDNWNPEFDKLVKTMTDDDEDFAEFTEATNEMLTANVELAKRVKFYEAMAQQARHARRELLKSETPDQAAEANGRLRAALRAIHPSHVITNEPNE